MRTVRVAAAIIRKDGKVLATERGYGEFRGRWEFPGGKIEAGETGEAATVREVEEELRLRIRIDERLMTVEYDYPAFHLSMECFLCAPEAGRMVLTEHLAAKLVGAGDIDALDWLDADRQIVAKLKAEGIV